MAPLLPHYWIATPSSGVVALDWTGHMQSPLYYPRRIDPRRFARNGFVPDANFPRRIAYALDHVLSYRRKSFFSIGNTVTRMTGAAGTTTWYRFRCHTGYAATHISVDLGLLLADSAAAVAPRVDVNCKIAGGATTTQSVYYGLNQIGTVTDSPSEVGYQTVRVPVSANTTYEVSIDAVDYARILSCAAYEEASPEIDTTVDYYVDGSPYAVGTPIYDSNRQELVDGLNNTWKRNRPHLLCLPGFPTASYRSTSSTTWTNVIDTTTAVASSSVGWVVAGDGDETGEMLARLSDNKTVDVVFAAYLSVTGGATTGEVRLQNGSGTVCSLTGAGSAAAWYSTATTISGLDVIGECDLQFRTSDATKSVILNAVSLYCYL